jgi:hypothetical protein
MVKAQEQTEADGPNLPKLSTELSGYASSRFFHIQLIHSLLISNFQLTRVLWSATMLLPAPDNSREYWRSQSDNAYYVMDNILQ